MTQWSERLIARAICNQLLTRKCIVLVPNTKWTGYECDVLGVTMDRRIIDIEVKISRADLKADAHKDKWWKHLRFDEAKAKGLDMTDWRPWDVRSREPREWPVKVWKHYYAMPADIWKPELIEVLPSTASGVLLLREGRNPAQMPVVVQCVRRSKPAKDPYRLSPEQCLDIARLANLRMWESFAEAEAHRRTREMEPA